MSQNASLAERRKRDWGRPMRSAHQPTRQVREASRRSSRRSSLAGDPLGRPDPRL